MKSEYAHLTKDERDQLAVLRSRVLKLRDIGTRLGRNPSTWTAELIVGQFRKFRPGLPPISTEAIYQWIYADAPHLIGYLPRSHKQRHLRRSVTYDNGTENSEHDQHGPRDAVLLLRTLPQLGEGHGGKPKWIGPPFLPKKRNLDNIEDRAIQQAEDWINNRP